MLIDLVLRRLSDGTQGGKRPRLVGLQALRITHDVSGHNGSEAMLEFSVLTHEATQRRKQLLGILPDLEN
jgi:hypothetical protein